MSGQNSQGTQDTLMVGVSGVRGVVGRTMTPLVAARFAGALAEFLGANPGDRRPLVLLARDGREGGLELARAAAGALRRGGCEVIDLEVVATPTAAFALRRLSEKLALERWGAGASRPLPPAPLGVLIVTASHNPQEWNGLKVILPCPVPGRERPAIAAPPPETARRLVELFERAPTPAAAPAPDRVVLAETSATSAHVRAIVDALRTWGPPGLEPSRLAKGLTVAADSVNASGAAGCGLLLSELGCTAIVQIAGDGSGIFPHAPEPVPENLGALGAAVRERGAHMGLAQDPDADRLALVDERGEPLGEEYTLALCAQSVLEMKKRRGEKTEGLVLAANLSTSRMIEDVAAAYGARVERTSVGEAHVAAALARHDAPCGGEGNGGIIWTAISHVRDSLSGIALALALMKMTGKSLRALADALPRYEMVKLKAGLADRGAIARGLEHLAFELGKEPGAEIDRRDGVRAAWAGEKSWVHARASNTEPIARIIAEAPTPEQARALADRARGLLAAAR